MKKSEHYCCDEDEMDIIEDLVCNCKCHSPKVFSTIGKTKGLEGESSIGDNRSGIFVSQLSSPSSFHIEIENIIGSVYLDLANVEEATKKVCSIVERDCITKKEHQKLSDELAIGINQYWAKKIERDYHKNSDCLAECQSYINEVRKQEKQKVINDCERGYIIIDNKVYIIEELDKNHDLSCEGSMCWCEGRRKKCKTQEEYNKRYRGFENQKKKEMIKE